MRNFFFCILLIFYFSESFSDPLEKLTRYPFPEIRQHLFAFQFDSVESKLKVISSDPDLNLIVGYYRFQVSVINYLINENEIAYKKFEIDYSAFEKKIDLSKNSILKDFLVGEANFWKCIIHSRGNELFSAAWAGNKSYRAYRRAESNAANHPDILKGIGIFNYMVGIIPSGYSWITNILGFSGSISLGLLQLNVAANSGKISHIEARYFISIIELFINRDHEKSIQKLVLLNNEFPDNGIFSMTLAVAYQRNRQIIESKQLMEEKLVLFEKRLPAFADVIKFRIAESYFFLNDFEKSEKLFKEFLTTYQAKSLENLARFRLGMSQLLTGNLTEARQNFEKINPRDNFDFDHYSKEVADLWKNRKPTEAEGLLWLGRNYFDSGQFGLAEKYLSKALTVVLSTEIEVKGEIYYRLGRLEEESGNLQKSIQYYELAETLPYRISLWIPAYASFQKGKVLVTLNRKIEAIANYQKATKYNSHVFSRSLSREIDTAIKQAEGK